MTSRLLLIATALGLATALLLLAPLRLGLIGVMLGPFALLPLFVSALGFGTLAGAVSGLVAALIIGILFGPMSGLASFLLTLVPAVWAGHMAGLMRTDHGVEEWYPVHALLFRMTLLSAALTIAFGWISGFNAENLVGQMEAAYGEMLKSMPPDQRPPAGDIAQMATQVVNLLPYVAPASLLLMYGVNLMLGARIARSQGWMMRPKDDLPRDLSLPAISVAIFAAGLVATFAGGNIGLLGQVIVGAFGFAVLHLVLRNSAARGVVLGLLYAATLLILLPAFFMCVIGMAETLLHWRVRYLSQSNE